MYRPDKVRVGRCCDKYRCRPCHHCAASANDMESAAAEKTEIGLERGVYAWNAVSIPLRDFSMMLSAKGEINPVSV